MSRIGAKASRARKEEKIRAVVSLAIAEGLIGAPGSKVDPIRDLTRLAREDMTPAEVRADDDRIAAWDREDVAWETRVLLGFGTAAIVLGVVYALHSFANP